MAEARENAPALSSYETFRTLDQSVLEAMPVAVYVCAADGTILRFNRRAADLWGRSPQPDSSHDRFCGAFRLYHPDGRTMPHDDTPMAEALRTGEPQRDREFMIERPDGSRRTAVADAEPLRDAAGQVQGAVGCLREVWRRMPAEDQRLVSIVESSDDAIVSKDLDGIIVSWNKGAERLFGYTADEIVGRPVTTLIPADRQDEEPGILARIRRGERVDHYETIRQRKDGSLVDISLTVSPVMNAVGRIVGASKIARDITERKRSAAALARRADEQAALYAFTDRLHRGQSFADVYEAAFDTIARGLRCHRAAILLFDGTGVMRFGAWRGLSDAYRRAVDGHSPWSAGMSNPPPVAIDDIGKNDELPEALKSIVRAEGIRALAFIPVVVDGQLIGKVMAYFGEPHAFTHDELDLAVTIARQLGFAIERRRAEDQRDLLVAELSHRVKNTLATVISIAHQSFSKREDVGRALRSFDARIRALAQTHNRLADANWSGVLLEAILLDELAPYRRDDGSNVHISGPAIMVKPRCAVMLGMAIHELTTNAAKYGALSTKDGSVNVAWQTDRQDRQLRIRWIEAGGPTVTAPGPRGFGRLLLERAVAADLQGDVALDFSGGGLTCRIDLPLDEHLVGTNRDLA